MKDNRDVRRSRNARLNQAAKLAREISLMIESQKSEFNGDMALPRKHLDDVCFWANVRDNASELAQCVHEANAYNNTLDHTPHKDTREGG